MIRGKYGVVSFKVIVVELSDLERKDLDISFMLWRYHYWFHRVSIVFSFDVF